MLLFWILLTVVVCFFLYLYMIMPNTSRRSKILPYLKRDYAHRGLHDSSRLIPENSMPAFREAVKQNLAIELDIHLTRDGKVVVFHDESLKRICNAIRNQPGVSAGRQISASRKKRMGSTDPCS